MVKTKRVNRLTRFYKQNMGDKQKDGDKQRKINLSNKTTFMELDTAYLK